jgi:hypothetical protein
MNSFGCRSRRRLWTGSTKTAAISAPEDIEHLRVTVVEDDYLIERACGNAGSNWRCGGFAVFLVRAEKNLVKNAVIGAGEHGDLVAASYGAGNARRGQNGFRAGVSEADAGHASELFE